ncbi:MAG: hypothetical protein ISR83_03240 [Candidatus Marinimicrobia bacterium]|nr:hypothetical protein [Candidatus Neomarinimicrobiota bacterium]
MTLFSKEDLEYFDHCLGKKPTKNELKLLSQCLSKEIINRNLRIIDSDENISDVRKKDGVVLCNNGKLNFKDDSSILKFLINGELPDWIVYTFLFKPSVKEFNRLQEILFKRIKYFKFNKIHFQIPKNAVKRSSGVINVQAFKKTINNNIKIVPTDIILSVQLSNPKQSINSEKILFDIFNQLRNEHQIKQSLYVYKNIGEIVSKLIHRTNIGIIIHENNIILHKKYAFLIVPKENVKIIQHLFKKNNIEINIIGRFNDDPYLHYYTESSNCIKLPKSILSLQAAYVTKDLIKKDKPYIPKSIPKFGKRKLSQIYFDLSQHLEKDKIQSKTFNSGNDDSFILSDAYILNSYTDGEYVKHIYSFLGRRVSKGTKINHIIIDIALSRESASNGIGSLNQTISNELFILNITSNFNVTFTDSKPVIKLNAFVKNVSKLSRESFQLSKSSNYFISMAGVLKGQLINSKVMEFLGISHCINPVYKLEPIEINTFKTIQYCLKEKIVESAIQLTSGGLTIALKDLMLQCEEQYGAKIFISRKMSPLELLFGEQFGSYLVILNEENLMEFQRICMRFNTPNSTIGRVIETPNIVVNDYLNIPL